jgi:hypothetical protein
MKVKELIDKLKEYPSDLEVKFDEGAVILPITNVEMTSFTDNSGIIVFDICLG